MTLLEKLKMIERIDGLIRRKATGTPKQLASRLNISERCLFKTLNLMKEMGAPIHYSISRESYAYEYEVDFSIGFCQTNSDQLKVVGGIQNLFFICLNAQNDRIHCNQMHI